MESTVQNRLTSLALRNKSCSWSFYSSISCENWETTQAQKKSKIETVSITFNCHRIHIISMKKKIQSQQVGIVWTLPNDKWILSKSIDTAKNFDKRGTNVKTMLMLDSMKKDKWRKKNQVTLEQQRIKTHFNYKYLLFFKVLSPN